MKEEIYKFLLLAFVLLIVLLLFVPKTEFFATSNLNNELYNSSQDINRMSTYLYEKNGKNETQFLTDIGVKNTITDAGLGINETMYMNRCIQFKYDKKDTFEKTLDKMRKDGNFFISEKITVDTLDFSQVESVIAAYIMKLYALSNKGDKKVYNFMGPAYILLVQYPNIVAIDEDCQGYQASSQYNISQYQYRSKTLGYSYDITENCAAELDKLTNVAVKVEAYLLLPVHRVLETKVNGKTTYLVGDPVNDNWDSIKCKMKTLFAINDLPQKESTKSVVVDSRSLDPKCFLLCPGTNNNRYAVCGARSGKNTNVLGIHTPSKLASEFDKYIYANLYLINSTVMNARIGTNTSSGIFKDCVTIQSIPSSFTQNSTTCNSVAQKVVSEENLDAYVGTKPFNIKISNDNKCLTLNKRTQNLSFEPCKKIDATMLQNWYVDESKTTNALNYGGALNYHVYTTSDQSTKYWLSGTDKSPGVTTDKNKSFYVANATTKTGQKHLLKQLKVYGKKNNKVDMTHPVSTKCLTLDKNKLSYSICNKKNNNLSVKEYVKQMDEKCPPVNKKEFDANIFEANKFLK